MKKIILTILLVFMATSMLACSNDTTPTPAEENNNGTTNVGEERETTLKESIYGFDIVVLPGFALKESETGKSYITMDTDKNFELRLTNEGNDINREEWKKAVESEIKATGNVVEIDPSEHPNSFYHDAYYYLTSEDQTLTYMLKEFDGEVFEIRVLDPAKIALGDRSPVWLMLETINVRE